MQTDQGPTTELPADDILQTVRDAHGSREWDGPVEIPVTSNVHLRVLRWSTDDGGANVAVEIHLRDADDQIVEDIWNRNEVVDQVIASAEIADLEREEGLNELGEQQAELETNASEVPSLAVVAAFLRGIMYQIRAEAIDGELGESVNEPRLPCMTVIDDNGFHKGSGEEFNSGPSPFDEGSFVFVAIIDTKPHIHTADDPHLDG